MSSKSEKETFDEETKKKKAKLRESDKGNDEEWKTILSEELKAKSEQYQCARNLRRAEPQLISKRFEQDKIYREAAWKENAKQLELLRPVINKLDNVSAKGCSST